MSEVRGKPAYTMAVIVLIVFLVLIAYLITKSATTELQWTRLIYVFGGVEAIAFSAAGFIFGKEVHREQVAKSEDRANEAKIELKGAQEKVKAAYGDKVAAEGQLSALTNLIEVKRASMPAATSQRLEFLAKQSSDLSQGQGDKEYLKGEQPFANIDASSIALDELARYAVKLIKQPKSE
jgi:hypothetical protein